MKRLSNWALIIIQRRGGGVWGVELGSMNNADSFVDIIDYVGVMLYGDSIIIYFI